MKNIFRSITIVILFIITAFPLLAQTSTEEADTIRDRVQQKLAEARQNPKAYIGSVTDKTGNGLQIRNGGGEIKQVAIDETTTFAKTGKSNTAIKFSDIAIGDYIVAMGFIDPNQVLESKRILQTEPLDETSHAVILATVTEVSRNGITVSDKKSNTIYTIKSAVNNLVTFTKDGIEKKSSFSVIDENDSLIIVGTINGNTIEARRIHILPLRISPTPEQ